MAELFSTKKLTKKEIKDCLKDNSISLDSWGEAIDSPDPSKHANPFLVEALCKILAKKSIDYAPYKQSLIEHLLKYSLEEYVPKWTGKNTVEIMLDDTEALSCCQELVDDELNYILFEEMEFTGEEDFDNDMRNMVLKATVKRFSIWFMESLGYVYVDEDRIEEYVREYHHPKGWWFCRKELVIKDLVVIEDYYERCDCGVCASDTLMFARD